MSKWGVVVTAAIAVAVGCSQSDVPPSPAVFTLFDVQALYAEGRDGDHPIAVGSSLPGGIPIRQLMSPDGVLKVQPTWAEGYNAAYVVTDVWTDFDELWIQPAYVPVKGWTQGVRAVGEPQEPGLPQRRRVAVGGRTGQSGAIADLAQRQRRLLAREQPEQTGSALDRLDDRRLGVAAHDAGCYLAC